MKKHEELVPAPEIHVVFKDGEYHCVCYPSDNAGDLAKDYNSSNKGHFEIHKYTLKVQE